MSDFAEDEEFEELDVSDELEEPGALVVLDALDSLEDLLSDDLDSWLNLLCPEGERWSVA